MQGYVKNESESDIEGSSLPNGICEAVLTIVFQNLKLMIAMPQSVLTIISVNAWVKHYN